MARASPLGSCPVTWLSCNRNTNYRDLVRGSRQNFNLRPLRPPQVFVVQRSLRFLLSVENRKPQPLACISLSLSLSLTVGVRSSSLSLSLDPTGIGLPFVWLSFFVSFFSLNPRCLSVCVRVLPRPFGLTTDGYPNPRSKKSIRLTDRADQSCLAEPSTALVPVQRPAIDRVDSPCARGKSREAMR